MTHLMMLLQDDDVDIIVRRFSSSTGINSLSKSFVGTALSFAGFRLPILLISEFSVQDIHSCYVSKSRKTAYVQSMLVLYPRPTVYTTMS